MVDEPRVHRLVAAVLDAVAELEGERGAERDRRWLNSVKYLFVVAIEGGTDLAQHLCASEGWGPPSDNGDAMRLLARHGVVPGELGDDLARAVGFRNLLVHQYARVDDERVVRALDRLGNLRRLCTAVLAWVERQQHD